MKNLLSKILLIYTISAIPAFSANEIAREGICGDRYAQPGPDPWCDPSDNLCYVKIYYDDGTTGVLEAVWEPGTSLGYGNVAGVTTYNREAGGFYYHINLKPETEIFPAPTEQHVHDWIANQ